LAEDHHGPAVLACVALELRVGIDRDRVPDRAQHRQIARRIAVGVALREIESIPAGQLGDRIDLPGAVAERSVEPARVHAVDHLADRADATGHAE
jgi:hypothetical protein